MTAQSTALRTWLDAAWDRHDREPRAIALELAQRAADLPDDVDGAEAIRLARHVMLGHLAATACLRDFLAMLPAGTALNPMRDRALWALATLEGHAGPELPEGVRHALLADVAQAEIELGRLAQARARIAGLEAGVAAHPDEGVRRAYAATCNNLALALRTGPRGDAARDSLMIELAELARRAWARAGTWMHVERADYQLAMCHAAIGQGAQALDHARACLARCEAEAADAYERFFAHEALVHAYRAAADAAAAHRHRDLMAGLLTQLTDPGQRAYCEATFRGT
jgi:hypothetical protein